MAATRNLITRVTVTKVALAVTGVAAAVVLIGGTTAWLLERTVPGGDLRSWGDSLWWALTTLTTVGYGDQVPLTTGGRVVAVVVMIAGVAVIGGVAAGVALVVSHAVANAEEQLLEAEAETLEQRLEVRLDRLDERLQHIEAQLRSLER